MCLSQYFLPIPGPEIGKIYVEMRVISRQFVSQARTATRFGVINDIRRLAVMCNTLTAVSRSSDPNDDYLLALCQAADADYLITGDKSHLLALERHEGTRIVSAKTLVELLNR